MKKLFFTLVACMLISVAVYSQDYKTGIGYRGGPSNGLTIKHFITYDKALEGLLTARFGGYNITGLFQIHDNIFDANGLYVYYGFGGHIGSWGNPSKKNWWDDNENHSVIGIDGIIGIEYNLSVIPFNISLDWKPGLNIVGYPKFWSDELSLSIRYIWGDR